MQFLTNPDGTIPRGATVPPGARLTRPTIPPIAPAGFEMRDLGDGELVGNVWHQRWTAVPMAAPAVPRAITPVQARRALRAAGLLEMAQAIIAQSPADVQEVWEYAVEIPRDDPDLNRLAALMGLTPDQVDDLFRDAINR